jgi:hypothetical protein
VTTRPTSKQTGSTADSAPARRTGPESTAAGPPAPPRKSQQAQAGQSAPMTRAQAERERRLRRARFLAELAEARELRKRVMPRRTRNAELHARLLRTFRY